LLVVVIGYAKRRHIPAQRALVFAFVSSVAFTAAVALLAALLVLVRS
jgi:hypothetical protein